MPLDHRPTTVPTEFNQGLILLAGVDDSLRRSLESALRPSGLATVAHDGPAEAAVFAEWASRERAALHRLPLGAVAAGSAAPPMLEAATALADALNGLVLLLPEPRSLVTVNPLAPPTLLVVDRSDLRSARRVARRLGDEVEIRTLLAEGASDDRLAGAAAWWLSAHLLPGLPADSSLEWLAERLRPRPRRLAARAAPAALLALSSIVVTAPDANALCCIKYSEAQGVLSVGGDAADDTAIIEYTSTGHITVNGMKVADPDTKAEAMLTNTDKVMVDLGGGDDEVAIESAPGFMPGKTAESPGVSEIEFEYLGGEGTDKLVLTGTDAPDNFKFEEFKGNFKLDAYDDLKFDHIGNFNFDADDDVGFSGVEGITVDAGAGNDQVSGLGSAAGDQPLSLALVILGGAGNDMLQGGIGPNEIDGGEGADQLVGCIATDMLVGGSGPDILTGGGSDDTLDGGPEIDAFLEYGKTDQNKFCNVSGGDRFVLTNSSFTGQGTDTLANIERATLIGGGKDETFITRGFTAPTTISSATAVIVNAGGGNDKMVLGNGNDKLYFGAGDDKGKAGGGNDLIVGGKGDDTANGGAGKDRAKQVEHTMAIEKIEIAV